MFQSGQVLPSILNMLDDDHNITQDSGFESILPTQQSPNNLSTSTSPPPSSPSPKRASVSPKLKIPQPAAPPSPPFPAPELHCSACEQQPTEHVPKCDGIQYLSAVQWAVAESQESLG